MYLPSPPSRQKSIKLLSTIRRLLRSNLVYKEEKSTQPAFTCSKLTIETLEQGVKYVQS